MNRERLKEIIDIVEADPDVWYQGAWHGFRDEETGGVYNANDVPNLESIDQCGTCHCIAGWAQLLWARKENKVKELSDVVLQGEYSYHFGGSIPVVEMTAGKEWLDLTEEQASYLFAGHRSWPEILEFYDSNGEVPL